MTTKLVEHPSEQDWDECIGINDKENNKVEEFKQQYEDFKRKTNEYNVSS